MGSCLRPQVVAYIPWVLTTSYVDIGHNGIEDVETEVKS